MQTLHIVKIGGNIIDDPVALDAFLETFSTLKGNKILVHGGGKMATDLGHALGIPQHLVNGRRITDTETLKVAVMVYAGLVNKNIVGKLQSFGCNAFGLSGADGNLLTATRRIHAAIDFGWVGDISVENVNTNLLQMLLDSGFVPIISPVTHDGNGHLLNTNADTIASVISSAMASDYAVKLTYCFEKNGVLRDVNDEDSMMPFLKKEEYLQLKNEGIISQGMIPKLDNAFNALDAGIAQLTICHAKHLQSCETKGMGTYLIKS
jgi:acetylglutamate kinase